MWHWAIGSIDVSASGEVAADNDRWVGLREQWRSGQQMVGSGRKCVLIGASVHRFVHQLFRRGIRQRAHRHVGGGQAADVADVSGNSEVAQ